MTQTVSKVIADRRKIVNTLISALDVHGGEVLPDLEKRLFPNGVPQNLTIASVVGAIVSLANDAVKQMEQADLDHAVELSDDDAFRLARQAKVAKLRIQLSAVRSGFLHGYGTDVATAYNLNASIPDDVPTLFSRTASVIVLLSTRPLTETPELASMALNPTLLAGELQTALNAAQAADKEVERERKEAELTLSAKHKAMEQWPNPYSPAADALACLFVLAGHPTLADRVRPTAKRRSGVPETDDETPGEGNTPPTP